MSNENNENKEEYTKSSNELLKDIVKDEKKNKDKKKDEPKSEDKDDKDKRSKKDKDEHFNTKKIKHGTMSTALTVVFIAMLVMINVVATMIFERYPVTIDLTKDKIYSMSEESEEYVKKVDVDVLVTIFQEESAYTNANEYNQQAIELLKNYCKMNHHITYRFVDINSNPDVVKNYDDISQSDIVFETKSIVDGEEVKRVRKLGMLDLLSFSDDFISQLSQGGYSVEMLKEQYGSDLAVLRSYGQYVEGSNAEQAFTSALMTVTDPNPVYVTFLTGRDEVPDVYSQQGGSPFQYFKTLLIANGYNVNEINITKEDIPENTNVVVIPAPTTDYLENEIAKISDYMNNGGALGHQMIYVASYSQKDTPNLDEFLAEYGLEIGDGAICESFQDNYVNYQFITTITDIEGQYKQDIVKSDLMLTSQYSRPVNTLFDKEKTVTTEKYLLSSPNAFTAKLGYNESYEPVPVEKYEEGQQCYCAVSTKTNYEDDGSSTSSNLICVGSEYLLQNNALAAEQFDNAEYFFSVLNGITHKTDGIFIQPKTIKSTVYNINQKTKQILKWTFSFIIPVAVLIAGLVVWLRRKNK